MTLGNITFSLPPFPILRHFQPRNMFHRISPTSSERGGALQNNARHCLLPFTRLHTLHCRPPSVTEPSRKVGEGSITRGGGAELCLNICEAASVFLPVRCIVQCALLFSPRGRGRVHRESIHGDRLAPAPGAPLQDSVCAQCV